ncbi:hypothetical protein [Catellatospora vulcania]|uniref:hypothetical protein n=1 Tax=Catellatospora vulcania TaxID=1460450 RepID=UPI0012D3A894|nr:hypothetical protein [Catellatospora vulcania]
MQTKWETQHRKVLVHLVADAQCEVGQVDVAAYAAALGMSREQIHDSLVALADGRLVHLGCGLDGDGHAVVRVLSVSAMARQICDAAPNNDSSRARPPVSTIDEVVLRATTGP